jgi:hypothetical protein
MLLLIALAPFRSRRRLRARWPEPRAQLAAKPRAQLRQEDDVELVILQDVFKLRLTA